MDLLWGLLIGKQMIMKNTVLLISMFLSLLSTVVHAQNWDEICNSRCFSICLGFKDVCG